MTQGLVGFIAIVVCATGYGCLCLFRTNQMVAFMQRRLAKLDRPGQAWLYNLLRSQWSSEYVRCMGFLELSCALILTCTWVATHWLKWK